MEFGDFHIFHPLQEYFGYIPLNCKDFISMHLR